MAEKARTGQRVHQLENLTAEGKAVADPEDDKLWLSLESKHHLLEFDYARTWDQELHHMAFMVKKIQRAWRQKQAMQKAAAAQAAQAAQAAAEDWNPAAAVRRTSGGGWSGGGLSPSTPSTGDVRLGQVVEGSSSSIERKSFRRRTGSASGSRSARNSTSFK